MAGIVGTTIGGIFALAIIIIGASLLLPLYKDTTAAVTQAQTQDAETKAVSDKPQKGERVCDLKLEFTGALDLKRSSINPFEKYFTTNLIVYVNEKDPLLLDLLRVGYSDRIKSGGTFSSTTTSGSTTSSSSSSSTTKTSTTSGSSTDSTITVTREALKNFKYTWLAGSCYNKGSSTPASFIQGLSFIEKIQNQDADKLQQLSEKEIELLNINANDLQTLSFEQEKDLKQLQELDFNGIAVGDSFTVQISGTNINEKALTDSLGNIVWEKRIEIPDGSQISIPYKWQVFFVLNDVKAQDYIIEFVAKEKSINEQPANEPIFYKVLMP